MSPFRSSLAAAALPLFATPALAQTQTPTQFVAEFTVLAPGEERVAERGEPIANISMRPQLAVELTSVPDERTQRDIGVSRDNPLAIGTRLYGSSNRRSLYCHLINDRIAGSSGTCFRDFENDGAFEQGVKLEAPSLNTDVVILDQSGEWHGGTFRDRVRIRPPLTYRPIPAEQVPAYPARLVWSANERRPEPEDYPIALTFSISEGEAGTSTHIFSECYVTAFFAGEPVTTHFYGNAITIHGFTDDGGLRYSVEPAAEPVTVGMIYRFESRSAYVGMAIAYNTIPLACSDPVATGEAGTRP